MTMVRYFKVSTLYTITWCWPAHTYDRLLSQNEQS